MLSVFYCVEVDLPNPTTLHPMSAVLGTPQTWPTLSIIAGISLMLSAGVQLIFIAQQYDLILTLL